MHIRFKNAASLLLAIAPLLGISECAADADGDGYDTSTDCDDANSQIHPDAIELCDGQDQNCNGIADEGVRAGPWYPDADGDGFGDASNGIESCQPPPGNTITGGDCDDADPESYPGAPDTVGDGLDSDCGGLDGPQPSVGLETSAFTRIQDALAAAPDDARVTVWIGPGTYLEHGIRFQGKALRLKSTAGEELTVIDGQSEDTVIYLNAGEGPDTVMEGFTVTGGNAPWLCRSDSSCSRFGGGIFVDAASPTLGWLSLEANIADSGAGMFVGHSSSTIHDVRATENFSEGASGIMLHSMTGAVERLSTVSNFGGGIALVVTYSSLLLENIQSVGNDGVGLGIGYDHSVYRHVHVASNQGGLGGGIHIAEYSNSQFELIRIEHNSTSTEGGAMYIGPLSTARISHAVVRENRAERCGGIKLVAGTLELDHVRLVNNEGTEYGGQLCLSAASAVLRHSTLTGGITRTGGGIYFIDQEDSGVTLDHSILAYNQGGNLSRDPRQQDMQTVVSMASAVYNPDGFGADSLAISGDYVAIEPGFLEYRDELGFDCSPGSSATCLPSNLHLALSSSLVDAGATSSLDPDGSPADVGAFGGAGGNAWDLDQDGLPDWFWPGTRAEAPVGFTPTDFDPDDLDALAH